jgi:hypothetical protein
MVEGWYIVLSACDLLWGCLEFSSVMKESRNEQLDDDLSSNIRNKHPSRRMEKFDNVPPESRSKTLSKLPAALVVVKIDAISSRFYTRNRDIRSQSIQSQNQQCDPDLFTNVF